MPLLCYDVGLVSELRLTAGCVLMDLASPAISETSVYANGFSGFGGLEVACWPLVPKFAGSHLAEAVGPMS